MAKYIFGGIMLGFFCCCHSPDKKPNVREALTGNWVILYPLEELHSSHQNQLYVQAQDSVVNLMGLKLVSFTDDGRFVQLDSLYRQEGKWDLYMNELKVVHGGTGWDDFRGKLVAFQNDTLQVVQYIHLDGDSIKLTWHLKKMVEPDKAALLFENENNKWRQPPGVVETEATIRKRLKAMLHYYAAYYEMVAAESIYFTGSRVSLPLKYYQHGIGLLPFYEKDAFSRLFFDSLQARQAYGIFEKSFDYSRNKKFPSGANYVIEYSLFLERMAGAIK